MINQRPHLFGVVLSLGVLISFLPSSASAQGTGRIVGRVLDAAHGNPIAGVQVIIAGTQIGTSTAIDGRYTLTGVPAGVVEVKARRIGYGPKGVAGIKVPAGGAIEQNIS